MLVFTFALVAWSVWFWLLLWFEFMVAVSDLLLALLLGIVLMVVWLFEIWGGLF